MKRLDTFNLEQVNELAKIGHPKHLDKLANHKKSYYRHFAAQYGTDKHKDKLAKDADSSVRATVAQFGNAKHKELLKNDPDPEVRMMSELGEWEPE